MGNYFDKKIIVSGLTVAAIAGIFSWVFFTESLDIIVFILIFILTLIIVFIAGFITGKLKSGPEWLLLLLEHWNKTKINPKDKASDKDDKASDKDDKTSNKDGKTSNKDDKTSNKDDKATDKPVKPKPDIASIVVVTDIAMLQQVMSEIKASQEKEDK